VHTRLLVLFVAWYVSGTGRICIPPRHQVCYNTWPEVCWKVETTMFVTIISFSDAPCPLWTSPITERRLLRQPWSRLVTTSGHHYDIVLCQSEPRGVIAKHTETIILVFFHGLCALRRRRLSHELGEPDHARLPRTYRNAIDLLRIRVVLIIF
jgi:hypothetical protein